MNKAKFYQLFRWELRSIPRQPLLWVVVSILFAAFLWGALNAGALHKAQNESISLATEGTAKWKADVQRQSTQYSRRSPDKLQYWQDPTDIDGYSRYYLREEAIKPHLPLSALSAGQSDLLPFIFPMKLETPFGVEPAYDFEHPRGLSLGIFDLGFAIIYFLPIGVILLVTMVGAFERDHGILRLAAAQAVSPRMLLGSKMLALGTWLVPALLATVVLALALAGAPLLRDIPGLFVAVLVIASYATFWFTLAYLVLSFQKGAATSASILIAIWALFGIVIPKGATMAAAVFAPRNSYVLYIDELRRVDDAVMRGNPSWDGRIKYWLDSRPEPFSRSVDPTKLTYAAHLVFAAVEREKLLRPTVEKMRQNRHRVGRWTRLVEILSPPVALQSALSTIAGTDPTRHSRFSQSVVDYQSDLRKFIYPRVYRQIVAPKVSTCVGCPGRLNFTEYGGVPEYHFPAVPWYSRLAWPFIWVIIFGLFSVGLLYLAFSRGKRWRAGELQ